MACPSVGLPSVKPFVPTARESEYVAIFDGLRLTEQQGFLRSMLEDENSFPLFFVDNRSAIDLAKTTVAAKKPKHFMLRWHAVRDRAQNLCWVDTNKNRSEPLTKGLSRDKHVAMFKAPEAHLAKEDEYEDDGPRVYFCQYLFSD